MRTSAVSFTAMALIARLTGSSAAVMAQEAAPSAGASPFTLSATITSMEGDPPVAVGDVMQTRETTIRWDSKASDPRFDGQGVTVANVDAYTNADPAAGGPEVAWGTIRIENEGGAWAGPYTGLGLPDQHTETVTWWLTGEGGYEGQSAFLRQSGHPDEAGSAYVIPMEGWVFPGPVPMAAPAD